MRVQLSAAEQNTWSAKFQLQGDDAVMGARRAQVSIVQGSADSTVTLRRYDPDAPTVVIQALTMTKGQVVEVVVNGLYDIGVATGGFGTGACLITVEQ